MKDVPISSVGTLPRLVILLVFVGIVSSWSAPGPTPGPSKMIESDQLPAFFKVEAVRQNDPSITMERFQLLKGTHSAYRVRDVDDFLNENKEAKQQEKAAPALNARIYQGPQEFPWVSVRRSYHDVLSIEDPTLQIEDQATKKAKFDDLDGALISYSRDFRKQTDTWSMEGALLAPFSFSESDGLLTTSGFTATRFGIIPSVSYHRVSTNGDPKGEVDQLTYRVGLFQRFESGGDFSALTLRVFGTYLTDSQHNSSVPAVEFEIEPQFDFGSRTRIGYRAILVDKPQAWRADEHDTALIAYQFRSLLHGEYVSVQNHGNMVTLKEEDIFRLGPVTQFDLKPFIFQRLSISLRYSYLPALSGQSNHDSLFTADAEWALVKDEEKRQKLSLKVSYLNGGLDLTKERAETLLIGLGATF